MMEVVDGDDLAQRLTQGRHPSAGPSLVARQLADTRPRMNWASSTAI